MRQVIAEWCLLLLAIALVLALLTYARGDDDAGYQTAKARAAIAIHATLETEADTDKNQGADAPRSPEPTTPAKPEVLMFFAPFPCPPCEVQKREIKGWEDAPFKIKTPAESPVRIEFYPFTVWKNHAGKWIYLEQWNGRADLVARWKFSQRKPIQNQGADAPRSPVNSYPAMSGYRARWTWPGDLRQHLKAVHGVSESLTQDQAEALHDALHEGYTLQQIKARLKVK